MLYSETNPVGQGCEVIALNLNLDFRMFFRLASFSSSVVLIVAYVALLISDSLLQENVAAWMSISSGALMIICALSFGYRLSNWLLWFSSFYFLLYFFGPMLGMLFIDPKASYLDYPTTFVNGISLDARVESYLYSGMAASLISVFSIVFPSNCKLQVPSNNRALEQLSCYFWVCSAPFVLAHVIWVSLTFSGNYSQIYSSEAKNIVSIIPYSAIFTNIFNISFYIWLASVPPVSRFKAGAIVFVLISLGSSLHGGRINFVVPLIFILWYWSTVYNGRLAKGAVILIALALFSFVFLLEMIRSQMNVDAEVLFSFLVGSLSKAQYILAVYLDNKELADSTGAIYWSAPLMFPVDYLIHGDAMVGQGYLSADLRKDLGHVLSSSLNFNAYVTGAGIGSSLVAESAQFGILGMFLLLMLFYHFYLTIFSLAKFRVVFVLLPIIFMHFLFSGRDTMFPNMWGVLKVIFVYLVFVGIVEVIKSTLCTSDKSSTLSRSCLSVAT